MQSRPNGRAASGATLEQTPARTREDQAFVKSLERGLAVIRALSVPAPGLTITEASQATGLTRAAVRRSLLTLHELGYVDVHERRFLLTPKVLELGYAYLSSLTLPQIAHPHLERLADQVEESTALSVLDGGEIVCVAAVSVKRMMTVMVRIGGRLPAHATSSGRVLLAALEPEELDAALERLELRRFTRHTVVDRRRLRKELDQVRRDGWSLVDQEFEEGLVTLAALVRDRHGRPLGAVNVFTHASRMSAEEVERTLLPPLLACAEAIERDVALAGQAQPSEREAAPAR